jgi:hypothetical protein
LSRRDDAHVSAPALAALSVPPRLDYAPSMSSLRRIPPLAVLLLAACGPAEDPQDGPQERVPLEQLEGGDYQFYTTATRDGCLDGALEALFMPGGPEQPQAFEYPVWVPGLSELPASYAVDFREPFIGMDVTVTQQDETTLRVEGSTMPAVALGGNTGDCVAEMQADAELWALGPARVGGLAVITVQNPRGSEGLCPIFERDPCQVELELEAERD